MELKGVKKKLKEIKKEKKEEIENNCSNCGRKNKYHIDLRGLNYCEFRSICVNLRFWIPINSIDVVDISSHIGDLIYESKITIKKQNEIIEQLEYLREKIGKAKNIGFRDKTKITKKLKR